MFKVILTGGIASGKSAASAHFEKLGVSVIDADKISRELVQPGQAALARIVEQFGSSILNSQGHLDRAALREKVFRNPTERKALEAILHPLIEQRMQQLAEQATSDYVVLVVPLFVETGGTYAHDRVLLIDVAEQVQKTRLAKRDDASPEQVEQRLAAQANRQQRLAAADDVILNDGDLDQLHAAVEKLHQSYLQMSKNV